MALVVPLRSSVPPKLPESFVVSSETAESSPSHCSHSALMLSSSPPSVEGMSHSHGHSSSSSSKLPNGILAHPFEEISSVQSSSKASGELSLDSSTVRLEVCALAMTKCLASVTTTAKSKSSSPYEPPPSSESSMSPEPTEPSPSAKEESTPDMTATAIESSPEMTTMTESYAKSPPEPVKSPQLSHPHDFS